MEIKISHLKRLLPDGIVMIAHWVATKQDGFVPFEYPEGSEAFEHPEAIGGEYKYKAFANGMIDLPTKDPINKTFVAYKDITEELVVQWVKEVMGEEQVAALEADLDIQIEAQKNPVSASGLPWVN